MALLAQIFGSLYGLLAVVFGAFGAHALKKIFTEDQLRSFETGVKYQMYHALALLAVGFHFKGDNTYQSAMVYCFIIGVFLFSFSIYGLTLTAAKSRKWKFLGPVTPLGGLLLVVGWALLFYSIIEN